MSLPQDILAHAECLIALGAPPEAARSVCAAAAEAYGAVVNAWTLPARPHYLPHAASLLADPAATRSIRSITTADDFLDENHLAFQFERAINLQAMTSLRPHRGQAIVITARNEGVFFLEWLAHHLAVGFEHVFVYTNDNDDGSEELFTCLAESGAITLIENQTGPAVNPQVKAYEHALNFLEDLRAYTWVAFLDGDEFVVPAQSYDHRVDRLLEALPRIDGTPPGSLSLSWNWIGSDGHVRRTGDGRVLPRFRHGGCMSYMVKSIVRPESVATMRTVHKPTLRAGEHGVNGAFTPIDMAGHEAPYTLEQAEIRHYWQKSFEEFLIKQSRGIERPIWKRSTSLFFDWDIPCTLEFASVYPVSLQETVNIIYAELLSDAKVAAAHERIQRNYGALIAARLGNNNLEALYEQGRDASATQNAFGVRGDVFSEVPRPSSELGDAVMASMSQNSLLADQVKNL